MARSPASASGASGASLGTLTRVTVPSTAASPTSAAAPRSVAGRAVRRGLRAGAVSTGLVLGSWAVTALAAPPEGWESEPNDSMLTVLLKLLGIPLAVIAVVTLLTYLPLIMRGGRSSTDSAGWFAEHSEWFGGPRTTPEALESHAVATEAQVATRGGASARW